MNDPATVGPLDRSRSVTELVGDAVRFYRRNLRPLVLAAGAVVLVANLVAAAALGELWAAYGHTGASTAGIAGLIATVVETPLLAAMAARLVLDVRDGRTPAARRALSFSFDRFAPMLAAFLLYLAAVTAGFAALVIPGILIAVSCYFALPAVAVDGAGPFAALGRSVALVRGRFWAVLIRGVVFQLLVAAPVLLLRLLAALLARATDAQVVALAGDVLAQALALPLVAVGATLYYLELRRTQN